jgi:DNA-binding LytR/AlgR family response regulator
MPSASTPVAVLAEDEALLRKALRDALSRAWPELTIAAECEDGASALEAIAEHAPDVAFLDIRMPGLTGLEVAAAASDASPRTRIVFTTAYDQYAIDAFERGAVDYLLKPVSHERLLATVQRLQARAEASANDAAALAELLRKLGAALPPSRSSLTWITASNGRETRLIGIDEVIYFRAADKYTTVVTADGEALLRTPIKDLLATLDGTQFKQIHRSTIVNLHAIASVARDDGGRGILRLKARPETLAVSQPFMALFRGM